MNRKRILCALLAVCLCVCAAGCGGTKSSSEPENTAEHTVPASASESMQLLYCVSDTFNPYTASTKINRELCELLYDPLIKTDNRFQPVFCLAASAENSGTTCTVTLRDAVFTDGSAVTAADVVYSCNLARNTPGAYASALYEVASVSAADGKTVVFRLTRRDPYFQNLLDFPVLKSGSDTVTDADGVLQPPVGCGRFRLGDDRASLVRNDGYYGLHPGITSVRLINAPDAESVAHYVEIGATDAYYTDMSDGNIVRMSGKKTDVNLNDLVYIGLNSASPLLQQAELRYAISSALDRGAVCKSAFYSNAVAATGFFHPDFADTAAVQTLKNTADQQISIENLNKIGYNSLDHEGYRVNASGKRLVLTLLVNAENVSRKAAAYQIAQQLKVVGIELRVRELDYENYAAALQSGGFELYLGEVRVLANMDLSPLVLPGGSVAYGVGTPQPAQADGAQTDSAPSDEAASDGAEATEAVPATVSEIYAAFFSGATDIRDIAAVLLTELPCIPVCYRMGLLFYDGEVCELAGASASDIFLSIAAGSQPEQ